VAGAELALPPDLHVGPWGSMLGGVLYFSGGHLDEVRGQIAALFENPPADSGYGWRLHPRSMKWYPITSRRVPGARETLARAARDAPWRLAIRSGAEPRLAAAPLVDVTGRADWEASLGYLGHLELALPARGEYVGELRERFADLALALGAASGHAGLCFLFPPDIEHAAEGAHLRELASRHPGLNICAPEVDVAFARSERLRSVDWLTWLGPALSARLDAAGCAVPPAGLDVEDRGAGLLVQAGPAPVLGTQGAPPPVYVAAGRWLRPLRALERAPLGREEPGAFDRAETEAWLARFDGV
jgi:hypothetical protein